MRDPILYNRSQFQKRPLRDTLNPICNGLRQLEICTSTAHFLRLPNELLERILDFVADQAALAALAQSSKHLQALAVPHISKRVVFLAGSERYTQSTEIYQAVEQYLSIPQINAIRAQEPELLGPPPFLPGRYAFGVPPQVRFLTEAVICCQRVDNIMAEYLCVFLRNARNLRLIQLEGQILPKVMAEVMRLEKLQGLYFTARSGFPKSYVVPDPHAFFLVHFWMKGCNSTGRGNTLVAEKTLATISAPEEGSIAAHLRLLTLVSSAPFDDSLATTLETSNSNHQLLARFQPVVHKLLRCDIVADDRVTVALPAIDYDWIGVFSIRESEPSILATMPDVVTRNFPLDMAASLRYLVMAVKTAADAAVLPRLAQIETLKLYLPKESRDLVATAVQHTLQLQSIKSLSIRVIQDLSPLTLESRNRSILRTDDIERILRSLPGLTELEIPIYTVAVLQEAMDELRAFRFSTLQTVKLLPVKPEVTDGPGLQDRLEAIIEAIVRCYGGDSEPAAWDRLQRLEQVSFLHSPFPHRWRIGTDEAELATLQETPFMKEKLRIVELADGRRAWFQKKEMPRIRNAMESWPWLDKAAEALQKMDEAEDIDDL